MSREIWTVGEDGTVAIEKKDDVVNQFNSGICENCGGELVVAAYVGGDHDEIVICRSCSRHYGCWECDRLK
jgi:hypothetical protein